MKFLDLSALWFLAVIPPVVLLYFMKLRRKEFKTTAIFLWNHVMQNARVDSFFQKLKVNVLLILQILIILFLITALARPYFNSNDVLFSETIFIIDSSASMGAIEEGRTRLEAAKDKIVRLLDEAPAGSSFMLISSSDKSEILTGFTKDKSKVKRLIKSVRQVDTDTDLKPALLIGLSLLKSHPDAGIFLIGDKLPDDEELDLKSIKNFYFLPIGTEKNNAAITAFDVRREGRTGPLSVFVRVENFSSEPLNTTLDLFQDNNLTDATEAKLPPESSKSFIFKVKPDFAGIIKAEIEGKDALLTDNTVRASVAKGEKLSLLIVTAGNPFLERAAGLIPDIKAETISPATATAEKAAGYGLVIWDNCFVPKGIGGKNIFINCSFADAVLNTGKIEKLPEITGWKKSHPVMRFVDLSAVSIAEAEKAMPPVDAEVLAESRDMPLIFLTQKGAKKSLFLTFDTLKSDWPLSPSYPIFLSNAVDYLSGRGISGIFNYRTGSLVELDFIEPSSKISVDSPPGAEADLSFLSGIPSLFLDRAGLYRVRAGKMTADVPANLLDRKESQIAPSEPYNPNKTVLQKKMTVPLIREIWPEIALVALLLLTLEWYVFNRRRV